MPRVYKIMTLSGGTHQEQHCTFGPEGAEAELPCCKLLQPKPYMTSAHKNEDNVKKTCPTFEKHVQDKLSLRIGKISSSFLLINSALPWVCLDAHRKLGTQEVRQCVVMHCGNTVVVWLLENPCIHAAG